MEGSESNLTDVWEYLTRYRGMQQQSLETAIPLTVVNGLIFITGLLGNVAVCVVIIRHPSMHTATHYYLFNLAVSDLALLVFGLPNDVAIYWHQYPWTLGESICKLRALLSEMASYVSVLTIVAFSTERYLAICYPLYLHTMSGLRRAVKIIACLWIVAFFSAMPFCFYTEVNYLVYPPNASNSTLILESAICGMFSQPEGLPVTELSSIIFFFIPMCALAFQYAKMAEKISKITQQPLGDNVRGSVHRNRRSAQNNRIVVRMLSAVVVGFFVCWAPFHTQRFWVIYAINNKYYEEINRWLFFTTGIFYYFSSTLNPILYNIMSDKMRTAFKEIFCGVSPKRSHRQNSCRETSLTYHVRLQASASNGTTCTKFDEEKLHLVDKDAFAVTESKLGEKIIYEIRRSGKGRCSCERGQFCETCM